MIGNSKPNHLGAQGTFKLDVRNETRFRSILSESVFLRDGVVSSRCYTYSPIPHNVRRRRLSNSIPHSQWPFLGGQAMPPPRYLTLYSALHLVTCFLGASRSHRFLTMAGVDGSVTVSPTPNGSFWEAKLCPPHGI